jgi:hypothetical protein
MTIIPIAVEVIDLTSLVVLGPLDLKKTVSSILNFFVSRLLAQKFLYSNALRQLVSVVSRGHY